MKEKWRGHSPLRRYLLCKYAPTPIAGTPRNAPRLLKLLSIFTALLMIPMPGMGGMWYPCYSVEKGVVTKKNAFFENKI